ncbi:2-dehydropantoate 2-reductase N-terminal domain-containing protein [Marinobacter sp. NSM]|uniref:2-dehydropantoate 2-reductase N-terminal domain-containing protein n=1 Tax=Marinobacter sp. NSM TaxID=3458004 RepID=UPI004035A2AE
MPALKILMIGAGGIGGYYAARLAEAGHPVVLTARGSHLEALKADGLTVDYEGQVLRMFFLPVIIKSSFGITIRMILIWLPLPSNPRRPVPS